jgi:hypothetical protein
MKTAPTMLLSLALLTGCTPIQTVQMPPDGQPYVVEQVVPD